MSDSLSSASNALIVDYQALLSTVTGQSTSEQVTRLQAAVNATLSELTEARRQLSLQRQQSSSAAVSHYCLNRTGHQHHAFVPRCSKYCSGVVDFRCSHAHAKSEMRHVSDQGGREWDEYLSCPDCGKSERTGNESSHAKFYAN